MKPGILRLSLVLACSFSCLSDDAPLHGYALTWTCLSPEGCERAEQVALIDRVSITDRNDFCEFWSTRDSAFLTWADLVVSDSLPPECFWLVSFSLFGHALEQSQLCRTEDGFEVELSIPDRDSPTNSKWHVEGRYLGEVELSSIGGAPRGTLRWQGRNAAGRPPHSGRVVGLTMQHARP